MNRTEFIKSIMAYCGSKEDEHLIVTYDKMLTRPYQVDWEAFYTGCLNEMERRSLPVIKWFTDRISRYKVRCIEATQYEGQKLFLFLKSGEIREYAIYNFGKPFSVIKNDLAKSDNVLKAIVYPQEVWWSGKKLFDQDDDGNTIEGQVLYEAGSF